MPTLYHQWLLNVIAANLTEQVLPLVAPSLMGARVLDYLRLSTRPRARTPRMAVHA